MKKRHCLICWMRLRAITVLAGVAILFYSVGARADEEKGRLTHDLTVGASHDIQLKTDQVVEVLKHSGQTVVIMAQLPNGSSGVFQIDAAALEIIAPSAAPSSASIVKTPANTNAAPVNPVAPVPAAPKDPPTPRPAADRHPDVADFLRQHGGQDMTTNPGLHYYYPVPAASPPRVIQVDVCIYGGTPGGVAAAVQAARMGKKAALAVFGRHVGGMTSGGLTEMDIGTKAAIGGIASEFMTREGGRGGFSPSAAEMMFRTMAQEAGVPVYFEHRLQDVVKSGNHVTALKFENGDTIEAKMFIDATYEGDLFARAGVSYRVGREDNSTYGETVNGFQIAKQHQFLFPVDPYRTPGHPASGLLPGISPDPPRPTGTGDKLEQAYNFRMWAVLSDKGIPWPKPDGYNADDYALLLRYLNGKPGFEWKFNYAVGPLKLNVGDCNCAGPFSTDFVGGSSAWPEAGYAERERIFQQHVTYQQGLMWFLANDPGVPEAVRTHVQGFGLPKDEFVDTGGWPHELYVREGRRMISDYVITEHNCMSDVVADDSVGLASYQMDSHNTSRVVVGGTVRAEGCVAKKTPKPVQISYRSIVPKQGECDNILVPVCLSATHVAYGEIRMEPVFMVLGQSAGTAAALAIDANVPVQKVDYAKLRERLLVDKQVLDSFTPPPLLPRSQPAP